MCLEGGFFLPLEKRQQIVWFTALKKFVRVMHEGAS